MNPKDDWLKFSGRKVSRVVFPARDDTTCPYIQTDEANTLVCHVECLGDRTEVWVANFRNGIEVSRHNARLAEAIIWATE